MVKLATSCAFLILAACSDDAEAPGRRDSAVVELDASRSIDARVVDATREAAIPSSGPLDAAQLPVMPRQFVVELTSTACFGDCPAYDVRVDQAGHVRYWGRSDTERPGVFEKDVAASAVQGLYEQLRSSPYFSLFDEYNSEEHCPALVLDAPANLWNVLVDGVRKPLYRDHGCLEQPALERVDALIPELLKVTETERWVGNVGPCEGGPCGPDVRPLAGSYRLAHEGVPRATVQFSANQDAVSWTLVDCDGGPLAAGRDMWDYHRSVLVDQAGRQLRLGPDLVLGAIELSRPAKKAPLVAVGWRGDDDIALTIEQGANCSP
jgi:hypothetical protein